MTPPRPEDGAGGPEHGRRFVVMGVSGAGKTAAGVALARTLGVDFLEGDALHPPANVEKMSAGIPLDDGDRAGWLATIAAHLADARAAGRGLVVACSALKRRYRDVLRGGDPGVTFLHLTGERALVGSRLAQRAGHFMPVSLLDSQFEALEPPDADERAIVVDVAPGLDDVIDAIVRALRADDAVREP